MPMPREAIRPSASLARFLRRKRESSGLSLREVSRRLGQDGEPIPPSTLARIEQGRADPGVRRVYRLLRLYQVSPQLAADLVELEDLAVGPPPVAGLETLFREGVEAWKRGELAKGLSYLFAVREYVPASPSATLLRQRATLSFAIAAKEYGKFRLAQQVVDDLLSEPCDPSLIVNVLVLASSLWRGRGSLEAALAFLRQAETHVASGKRQQHAWVQHQKAKLLVLSGKPAEAGVALTEAVEAYRAQRDTHGEGKALLLAIEVEEARGDLDRALECTHEALRFSQEHDHDRLVVLASVELGRLLVRRGETEAGLEVLQEALGQTVLLGDRATEFLAHYHLWKVHARLGDRDRARVEYEAAAYYVRFVDEASAEADEIRREGAEEGRPSHETRKRERR